MAKSTKHMFSEANCWQKKKTYHLYASAMTTLTTNESRTPLSIVAAISAVASLFLCWLVYYHAPVDVTSTHLLFLPALNALSAIALVTGFCFIRGRRVSEHRLGAIERTEFRTNAFPHWLIWWMGGMLFTVYHHAFGERIFEEPFTHLTSGIRFYSRLSSDRCGATPDDTRGFWSTRRSIHHFAEQDGGRAAVGRAKPGRIKKLESA